MNEHEQLVDQAARHARSVLFLGGLDAGKSTLARATAAFALRIGRRVAYIDADVAQKTVGPPATVGMKHIREPDDLISERMSEADALGFVGSISPQDHLVGLSDGHGGFTGLGVLEHVADDGGLRLLSPVAEPPKALRLGSVRLEDTYRVKRVDLRNLFGTE